MKRKATFGSIITATHRSEDLIPAFADELRRLRGALPIGIAREVRRFNADPGRYSEIGELIAELMDALQEFACPNAYFGAHPGDGSDYGFWLDSDFLHWFDGLRVTDTSEVPRSYRGEVLHVNDHGNLTLYVATSRGLREVWSVV